MIALSLEQLALVVGGKLLASAPEAQRSICEVTTDTRKVTAGALFIALRGERFDAHDFAAQAQEQGAAALLVERELPLAIAQIVVDDTRLALGQLGHWVRTQCRARVVAMTGSSGKTTVKEMTAAILAQRGNVLYTAGNFNNDIGVPLTLLRLTSEHDYAVMELGANHIGEIAYTTALVQPEAALVNNVMAAHLEGFGSLAGVRQAKGEIYQGLSATGTAIVNLDIDEHQSWQPALQGKTVRTWSMRQPADYTASDIRCARGLTTFTLHTPEGEQAIALPYPGLHNVSNALAAAALSIAVGASLSDVAAGLASLQPVKGRLYPLALTPSLLVWDDTYNANVGSMKAGIAVLAQHAGLRILIAGDMGELGDESAECHQAVGDAARDAGIDQVFTVGVLSQAISAPSQGQHFSDKAALLAVLLPYVAQQLQQDANITLLVKGSRSAAMEDVVRALQETFTC